MILFKVSLLSTVMLWGLCDNILHQGEVKIFYQDELDDSADVSIDHQFLIDRQNQSICEVHQRGLNLVTNKIQILNPQQIDNQNFNPKNPRIQSNCIKVLDVKKGVLVYTSDNSIYLTEYDSQFNNSDSYDKGDFQFSNLIWIADLNQLINSPTMQNPVFLYQSELELAFLLFNNYGVMMSIGQMFVSRKNATVTSLYSYVARSYLGFSVIYKRFIINAVGVDGVDIYKINVDSLGQSQVLFLLNIPNYKFFPSKADIQDIEIVDHPTDSKKMIVFLACSNNGVRIVQMDLQTWSIQDYARDFNTQPGGSIVAYYNQTLFTVYYQYGLTTIIEYWVDLERLVFKQINKEIEYNQVIDIHMSREFAIIEKMDQDQIVFYGQMSQFLTNSINNPPQFMIPGLRSFQIISSTITTGNQLSLTGLGGKNQLYQAQDYLLAITQNDLILARYSVHGAYIECYSQNISDGSFIYTVYSNDTQCITYDQKRQALPSCTKVSNFKVKLVYTLFDKDDKDIIIGVVLGVISFVIILFGLCIYYKYQHYKTKKHLMKLIDEQKVEKATPVLKQLENSDFEKLKLETEQKLQQSVIIE